MGGRPVTEFTGAGPPLSADGVKSILQTSVLGLPELWAVLSVETSGCGYLPDRRPKILFERHVFSRLTGHQFDQHDPDISQPTAGGYGSPGPHQYDRLNVAMQLDAMAALKSASWGLGQIMGENFKAAGFPAVDDMVAAMVGSEDGQLQAMVGFISSMKLIDPLQAHDWQSFARRYNGPSYAANNYDGLLQHFYARYTEGPLPDFAVRGAQIYLSYAGFLSGAIDGILGPATRRAIMAFQASQGLPQTGSVDSTLLTSLAAAGGNPARAAQP
jgi:N-acetylmuramidase/Putative peptidoglycan binding domain